MRGNVNMVVDVVSLIVRGVILQRYEGKDKMTANINPTIITSKLSLGVVPSTQLGNVSWSDDGQCLFLTKRGVTVMVRLSLPPPSYLKYHYYTFHFATYLYTCLYSGRYRPPPILSRSLLTLHLPLPGILTDRHHG
jgi:hypothetical protein